MIRRPRLFFSALCALLFAAVASCNVDQTGPHHYRPVALSLSPRFATIAAQATGPISVIRLTATEQTTNTVVGASSTTVNPTGAPWTVSVDVELGSHSLLTVLVSVELISKGTDGVEHVEWSGITNPIQIQAGVPVSVADVTLGRGPLANVSITAVTIADGANRVGLADSLTLTATATGATGTPTIFWTSLNDTIATVDATGKVRAVKIGTASIVATAGTKADTANILVFGGPASIIVSPTPLTLAGVGATQQLSAVVHDLIGGVLAQAPVTWTARNPAIATVSTTGLATAAGLGRTFIVASASATVLDSADVTVTNGASASVAIAAGDKQTATVGTAVAIAPAVRVTDANANPVPNVSITFAVASGAGSITGSATITTDATGTATVGGWTLGATAGANTLTATVTGFTPVTFTATATAGVASAVVAESGNAQTGTGGVQLTNPLVARVTDTHGNGVSGATVTFAPSSGGSVGTPTATSDANGRAQTTWTPSTQSMSQSVTATVNGLTPATFTATVTIPNPAIAVSLEGVDKVSLGRTATVRVTLNRPAPATGLVVTVASGTPSVLTVAAPPTVSIAGGGTTGTITVTGVAEGTSTVTATGTGYDPGSLPVSVELRLINLPATFSVPFGSARSLPITLARAAPAGGTLVTLSTSNPNIVGLSSTTVTIPAGATTANATLNGLLPGTSDIIATNPNYTPDTVTVTSAASLQFSPTSTTLNQSFGQTVQIQLVSNGVAIAAPAPGITVNFTSLTPACTAVPATATIPTGLVSAPVTVTYGGQGAANCTARVAAGATGIAGDTLATTVQGVPAVTLSNANLGLGLQRLFGGSLSASNHGGTTVHLVSADPTRMLLAASQTSAGAATLDIPIPNGQASFNYTVQSLGGQPGAVNINATATSFSGGTSVVTAVQPALQLSGLPTTDATFTPDDVFSLLIGTPNGTTGISEFQAVRIGGSPVAFTLTTTQPSVGKLVTVDSVGGGGIISIQPGQLQSQSSVATGGIAFRPIASGTTTVSATATGFTTSAAGTVTVTVSAPGISVANTTVGAGLERINTVSLGASNHGGVTVHLASVNPSLALLSATPTDAGTPSIDVNVPNGSTAFNFYVQGVDGTTGTTTVNVTAPGFTSATSTVTVQTPVLELLSLSTTQSTLDPNSAFSVGTGIGSSSLTEFQNRRGGAAPLSVTITSSAPSVGQLVTTATTGGSVNVQIAPGTDVSPGSVATGGVAFDPLTAGTTVVTASIPGFTTIAAGTLTVTVSASTISIGGVTVGAGLQRAMSGQLGASQHGGVNVTLTSSDPTKILLAKDVSTPATASISIPVANGTVGFSYYVAGVEATTGTAIVTASAPGFTNGTATMTEVTPAVEFSSLNGSLTTLDPNDPFIVLVGVAGGTSSLNEFQAVRAGANPLTVTVTTSNPNVASLVSQSTSGAASVTTQIAAQQDQSPSTVATGGIALDPITNGTTNVVASIPGFTTLTLGNETVTVTSPPISMSPVTVGAGLQRANTLALGSSGHGALTVTITSSQPQTALVSTSATSPGQASITINVPAGQTSVGYFVQGVENTTGTATITATASGFSDGTTTAAIQTPVFELSGLDLSPTTVSPDRAFEVLVGTGTTGVNEFQSVRPGAQDLTVTLTSTAPTVGSLATQASPGGGGIVTVKIPVGQFSTASSVATGGVAFHSVGAGTTIISASIPGFNPTNTGAQSVTVSAPTMTIGAATVGSGLQKQITVSFDVANPNPVTVHVASGTAAKLLIAPNATTAGQSSVDIVVPANQSSFTYFAQAVEGATGSVTVTTSAAGYNSGSGLTSLVAPSVVTSGLSASQSVSSGDANFTVQIGVSSSGQQSLQELQAVRAGAPSALTATITSSNAASATVKTTSDPGGGTLQLSFPSGTSSASLTFHPISSGQTTVAATVPGFTSIGPAVGQVITISP